MKTKLSWSYKHRCPSIKRKKEKGFKVRQYSLTVLKTYVISFPPKTLQKERKESITFKKREQFLGIELSLIYPSLSLLNASGTHSISYRSTSSTT